MISLTEQTPNNRKFGYIVSAVILILFIIALGLLGGCKSTEKRQAKMYGKFDKLKRKADADSVLKVVPPKWSLDNFPLTVGKGKTTFLPGRTIVKHDTTTKTKIVNDTVYIETKVVKYNNTVDTFVRVDSVIDSRPITQLQYDLRQLNDKLIQSTEREKQSTETKNKQRNKLLWSIGLNVLFILLVVAYFLRRFGIIR